jgi:site-specific recombinase XerD
MEMPEQLALLERPPKENKLPRDLDKDEIERLLRTITNNKHKCLLALMYSTGLRVGELVRLRLEDIDLDAKTVFVFQSKNNKDRFAVLGSKIIPLVQAYLLEHKPQYWLFEGPDEEPYTTRSVQEIFKRARLKARINKNVSTHALRHSYATHNLAKGVDIELLRNLMGHESLKTTQIYLHVTKERLLGTPSPFDDLDL